MVRAMYFNGPDLFIRYGMQYLKKCCNEPSTSILATKALLAIFASCEK